VQVIGDDDAIVPVAKRPGRLRFEINSLDGAVQACERCECGRLAIDSVDAVPSVEQQPRVASAASGEIEHSPARPDQRQIAQDPSGTSFFTTR
jgi:hypothetical protein